MITRARLLALAGAMAFGFAAATAIPASAQRPMRYRGVRAHRYVMQGSDRRFLMNAGRDGATEVELGRLAARRAADPRVRAFGNRMVRDHSQADRSLERLATSYGIAAPVRMSPAGRRAYDRLSHLIGRAFDREYMHKMVTEHEHAVAVFALQSRSARDQGVRAFASRTLPTLREHLRMARATDSAIQRGQAHRTLRYYRGRTNVRYRH